MKIIKRHESNDAATFWAWLVRGKTAMSFVGKRGQSKEGGHELSWRQRKLKKKKKKKKKEKRQRWYCSFSCFLREATTSSTATVSALFSLSPFRFHDNPFSLKQFPIKFFYPTGSDCQQNSPTLHLIARVSLINELNECRSWWSSKRKRRDILPKSQVLERGCRGRCSACFCRYFIHYVIYHLFLFTFLENLFQTFPNIYFWDCMFPQGMVVVVLCVIYWLLINDEKKSGKFALCLF